MSIAPLLRTMPVFADFTDEELEFLDRVMVTKDYPPRHAFIRRGEAGKSMTATGYVVLEGEVAVTTGQGKQEVELARFGPGMLFGMNALLDQSRRSADCRAVGRVKAAALSRAVLDQFYLSQGSVAAKFQYLVAHQLAGDLRRLTHSIQEARAGREDRIRTELGLATVEDDEL